MRGAAGTVSSAGQITTSKDRIKVIEFHARDGNSNNAVVGYSDVSAANGRELVPGEPVVWNFGLVSRDASLPFSAFYVYVVAGDKVDWSVVKE